MSNLYTTNPQGSTPVRQQDARAQAQAQAQTQAQAEAAQARIRTPRDIMNARTARQEQEARQRQTQESDPTRRRQQEGVVGVGATRNTTRPSMAYSEADQAARLPAGQNVTIGGRPDMVQIAAGNGPAPRNTVNQGQPRPVTSQQTQQPSQLPPSLQAGYPAGDASRIQRNRTQAYETLEMPAIAGTNPPQPQDPNYAQPSNSAQPARIGFPHAFERWETLSSHWEGLTSYWIRKLQENTNELDGRPIERQMARQITDLSAAGANLFHAVVELQRLRASSERKFQRWFLDTRNDQEQAQERVAELQLQLQQEKLNQSQTHAQATNINAEALQADKNKTEELLREMRRELQISKEEARRAWEELGRREQEERERTIALRSGEPTLIGGIQVLPIHGLSSRQNTVGSQRPVTQHGPYEGGPSATTMGGQQQPSSVSQTTLDSPSREQEQFSYQPNATSPTDTDPFTESTHRSEHPLPLRHEPDSRFVSTGSPQARQPGGAAAMAAARANIVSPTQSQLSQRNVSEGPSYIPSTRSGAGSVQSEEEFHMGPDGEYIRDPHGRPIPYRQPIGGYEEVDSDDEDHTADVQHEQMLAQQYAQRQQAARYGAPGPSNLPASTRSPQPYPTSAYIQATLSPQTQQSGFSPEGTTPSSRHTASTTVSPSMTQQAAVSSRLTSATQESDAVDYEGAGYGSKQSQDYPSPPMTSADASGSGATQAVRFPLPRHHVPTPLSDILEERTEPSRSSAISGTPTTHSETQGGILGTRR